MKHLVLTFLLALSALASPLLAAEPESKTKPNVLFIAVDDLNLHHVLIFERGKS